MLNLEDVKVTSCKRNESNEMLLNLRIKREDYSEVAWQFFADRKLSGESIRLSIDGMELATQESSDAAIKDKRQRLATNMAWYAQETNQKIEDVTAALYKQEGITSRTQLSNQRLDDLIESYRAGAINKEL
jgi:hypothetical protein